MWLILRSFAFEFLALAVFTLEASSFFPHPGLDCFIRWFGPVSIYLIGAEVACTVRILLSLDVYSLLIGLIQAADSSALAVFLMLLLA